MEGKDQGLLVRSTSSYSGDEETVVIREGFRCWLTWVVLSQGP